jgi:hypothetical protein
MNMYFKLTSLATAAFATVGLLATTANAYSIRKDYSGGNPKTFGYRAFYHSYDEATMTTVPAESDDPEDTTFIPGEVNGYSQISRAAAFAQAFGFEKEVVMGESVTGWASTGGAGTRYTLRVFKKTVLNTHRKVARETQDSGAKYIKREISASASFPVGPFTATVRGGASVNVRPRFVADIQDGYTGPLRPRGYENERYIKFQAGPELDIAAYGEAEVGVVVAGIGVRTDLSIYNAALLAEANLFFNHNAVTSSVVYERTDSHGSLSAYIFVGVDPFRKDYSNTIARFGDSTPKREYFSASLRALDGSRPVTTPPAPPPAPPPVGTVRWNRVTTVGGSYQSKTERHTLVMPFPGHVRLSVGGNGMSGTSELRVLQGGRSIGFATFSIQRQRPADAVTVALPEGTYTIEARTVADYNASVVAEARAYWNPEMIN